MTQSALYTYSLLLICLLIITAMGWAEKEVQPIQYNHKLHIEEAGQDCSDCHQQAETHSRASFPDIQQCGDCHDDPETDNPELQKVAAFVGDNKSIPWVQVHFVPDHVYFSHRRHVVLGELQCVVCHGDVSQMERPFDKPFVAMEMDWCMECHEQGAVTNDCSACHR